MSNTIIRELYLTLGFDEDRFWIIILRIAAFGISLGALTGK